MWVLLLAIVDLRGAIGFLQARPRFLECQNTFVVARRVDPYVVSADDALAQDVRSAARQAQCDIIGHAPVGTAQEAAPPRRRHSAAHR